MSPHPLAAASALLQFPALLATDLVTPLSPSHLAKWSRTISKNASFQIAFRVKDGPCSNRCSKWPLICVMCNLAANMPFRSSWTVWTIGSCRVFKGETRPLKNYDWHVQTLPKIFVFRRFCFLIWILPLTKPIVDNRECPAVTYCQCLQ